MKKNIITLLLILGIWTASNAQNNHRERIKAYKTAYITQELDLSPEEAEKFWPIYNDFEKQIFNLRVIEARKERDKIREQGGYEALSEKDAETILNKFLQDEKEMIKIKERLYNELSPVLSSVKMLKLYRADANFSKKLLSDYRRKKGGPR